MGIALFASRKRLLPSTPFPSSQQCQRFQANSRDQQQHRINHRSRCAARLTSCSAPTLPTTSHALHPEPSQWFSGPDQGKSKIHKEPRSFTRSCSRGGVTEFFASLIQLLIPMSLSQDRPHPHHSHFQAPYQPPRNSTEATSREITIGGAGRAGQALVSASKGEELGYSARDAARDAHAGACFVAWPADEGWRAAVATYV